MAAPGLIAGRNVINRRLSRDSKSPCEMYYELVPTVRLAHAAAGAGAKAQRIKIHQRGVQWKQGVVIYMMLFISLFYNATPIHCTLLRLHPPLMNTQRSSAARACQKLGQSPLHRRCVFTCYISYVICYIRYTVPYTIYHISYTICYVLYNAYKQPYTLHLASLPC